jgi:hypothetical protein
MKQGGVAITKENYHQEMKGGRKNNSKKQPLENCGIYGQTE